MSTTDHNRRHWFKSSFSRDSSNCVEVSLGWYKSSFSRDASNCVEIRHDADTVLVRDSKYDGDPAEQPTIAVAAAAWDSFLKAAAAGASNVPTSDSPAIEYDATTGLTTLRSVNNTALAYTPGEWGAFLAGVRDGEFDRVLALV